MPIKRNFIKKSIAPKSIFDDQSSVVDSTVSFNQGDLIVLDTSTHLLKTIAAAGSGELGTNFVGMARVSISLGVPISPIQGTDNDGQLGIPAEAGPVFGVTALVILKTGDALVAGGLVYPDGASGTRNVTSTVGSKKPIGVYQGPAISSAASGQQIEVLLGAQYPSGALQV